MAGSCSATQVPSGGKASSDAPEREFLQHVDPRMFEATQGRWHRHALWAVTNFNIATDEGYIKRSNSSVCRTICLPVHATCTGFPVSVKGLQNELLHGADRFVS